MACNSGGIGAQSLSKVAVLDLDDPTWSSVFQHRLLRKGGEDKGVPQLFIGYSTDFEIIDKKTKQYRRMNNKQQAIERQKWKDDMEDWEKFLKLVNELKRMQEDLIAEARSGSQMSG